jgi:hypothetical protein
MLENSRVFRAAPVCAGDFRTDLPFSDFPGLPFSDFPGESRGPPLRGLGQKGRWYCYAPSVEPAQDYSGK